MDAQMLNLLNYSPILPRSEIYYITRKELNNNEYMFKQIYRKSMSQPLIVELFGSFANNNYRDERENTPVSRRKDLNGIRLRACMVVTNNDTLNHLDDYR